MRAAVIVIIGFAGIIKCMEIIKAFETADAADAGVVGILDVTLFAVFTAVFDIVRFAIATV